MSRFTIVIALLLACLAAPLLCAADETKNPDALPQDAKGNFVLYVSNQSGSLPTVDVTITIDGKEAVDQRFDVGNAHNWIQFQFTLAEGKHTLKAVSHAGEATLEEVFEVKGKHWAVVDYWFDKDGGSKAGKKFFTFRMQDNPMRFR